MNNHKKIIAALECNGVDNWEWYDEVARDYNERREENDKMKKMQI